MSRIKLTDDIREQIEAERLRTRCGVKALFVRTPNLPDGLTMSKIDNWLRGNSATIRKDHLKFVLKAYAALPDNAKSLLSKRTEKGRKSRLGYVRITEPTRRELISLQAETKIYPTALLRGVANCPETLKPRMIRNWLSGKTKTADKAHLDLVLNRWCSDKAKMNIDRYARVKITPEIRNQIKRLRAETGCGAMKLLRGHKNVPEGLSSSTIATWLNGKSTSAKQEHLDYVLRAWQQVERLIPATDEMIGIYRAELDRTGIMPSRLLNAFPDGSDGLSVPIMTALRDGKRKSIAERHWLYILASLKALPDAKPTKKNPYLGRAENAGEPIAPTKHPYLGKPRNKPKEVKQAARYIERHEVEDLKAQIARTGVTATQLFAKFDDTKPKGLTINTIRSWLHAPEKKRTNPKFISWVLSTYRALPAKSLI